MEREPTGSSTPSVARAAGLMVVASFFFVGVAALVKAASHECTAMQAVLYRGVFSGLPLLVVMGARAMPVGSPRWRLLALRGAIGFAALFCYLWGVTHIPLADVLALQQLSPVLVALLAVFLLGERPAPRHWLLVGLCVGGALLVIRPTRGLVALPSLVAVMSAFFSAGAYVAVRALTRTESNLRIVIWFSGASALLALPAALPDWRWLSTESHLLLVGAGVTAAFAQTLMTAAYRAAPAHIASAFSYASVPMAYLAGLLVWDERPDLLSHLGILLIIAAGVALLLLVRPDQLQARVAPAEPPCDRLEAPRGGRA